MSDKSKETADLAQSIADIFRQHNEAFDVVAELDPAISKAYVELDAATTKRKALEPKYRALVKLALCASPTHLKSEFTRIYMAEALKEGATKEQILEVLEMISVLGIHGFIPGTFVVQEVFGGMENIKKNHLGPDYEARAKQAEQDFMAARGGTVGDVWETNCILAPDFVAAYAKYSGVPWTTSALPPQIKELMYVAIDLSPTHVDEGGATFHLKLAVEKYGATFDEVMEVLEIIGLFGFQTHIMALPILKEELERMS